MKTELLVTIIDCVHVLVSLPLNGNYNEQISMFNPALFSEFVTKLNDCSTQLTALTASEDDIDDIDDTGE